jgi:hypothetical protein
VQCEPGKEPSTGCVRVKPEPPTHIIERQWCSTTFDPFARVFRFASAVAMHVARAVAREVRSAFDTCDRLGEKRFEQGAQLG